MAMTPLADFLKSYRAASVARAGHVHVELSTAQLDELVAALAGNLDRSLP